MDGSAHESRPGSLSESLAEAANTIQHQVRGMLMRKEAKERAKEVQESRVLATRYRLALPTTPTQHPSWMVCAL
eukprot:2381063-Prymnesium_polylepis.2